MEEPDDRRFVHRRLETTCEHHPETHLIYELTSAGERLYCEECYVEEMAP